MAKIKEQRAERAGLFLQFAFCVLLCGTAAAAVPDGYVVRADSATIYLDWGESSGAKANDRFQIYRSGAPLKHPVTGEVLGKTQENLATGLIDRVEPKFAIGHMSQPVPIRSGDRSRWLPPSQGIQELPESSDAAPLGGAAAAPVVELWRSDALEKDPVGLSVTDLDGDGQKEIVLATRRSIQVYHLKDKRLEPAGEFKEHAYANWLAVETGDPQKEGHDKIFATAFLDGIDRPRVVVLAYAQGTLKRVDEFEGFARAFSRADGSRMLMTQGLSRSREINFTAPAELVFADGHYKSGKSVDLKLFDDQLFGWAWGDFDKNGVEDLAILEHGERIRLRFQDAKWKSDEVYGGTKNDFYVGDEKQGSLCPRLISWRPQGADRDHLMVVTNRPDLGVRLTHLKLFRRSLFDDLQWNGVELKSTYRIPVGGYAADFALADLLAENRLQLWALVEGVGSKSVLVSYRLP
jgi:hypothetical protein